MSFFNFLDTQMPVEQVIAVPKTTKDLIQPRLVDCDQRYPQSAEQLVEVPTKISFPVIVLYHAIMEHKRRTVEQNVDIPAVGGGAGDLQGFPSGQGSTAFSEQIPEFPDPGGGRQDFQPVQGSAASSSDFLGQAGQVSPN